MAQEAYKDGLCLDDVTRTVADGLCTSCGTCAGICPTDAIAMCISDGLFVPEIDGAKCNHCGLCRECCPGHVVDFVALNSRIFGKQPNDAFLGNFLECYVGYSKDESIRYNSASGGLATQILIFALEKGIIDGALVVRMKKGKPLEPEPFIARTRDEIISASKSKYCPVAANEVLDQILEEDGRFAVVGLPCHIHGIRKAEEASKRLKDKVVLHIGLMCSHAVSFTGTELLLRKMGVRKGQVTKLDYRGRGWPGSMSIQTDNRETLTIPLVGSWRAYWSLFSSFFFTPLRCIMCPDQTNWLSDISLGDAWLPELKYDKIGESVIIARTETAKDIITLMSSSCVLSIRAVSAEKVIISQGLNLQFKKTDLNLRMSVLDLLGRKIPSFNPLPTPTGSHLVFPRAVFPYFSIKISSSKHFRALLLYAPFPLFRLYYGIYKLLCSVRGSGCSV